jgi:hypothetical protein
MNFHKFDYIDRRQSSQFDFIRIPKAMMVSDGIFSELSVQAKLIYGLNRSPILAHFQKMPVTLSTGQSLVVYTTCRGHTRPCSYP